MLYRLTVRTHGVDWIRPRLCIAVYTALRIRASARSGLFLIGKERLTRMTVWGAASQGRGRESNMCNRVPAGVPGKEGAWRDDLLAPARSDPQRTSLPLAQRMERAGMPSRQSDKPGSMTDSRLKRVYILKCVYIANRHLVERLIVLRTGDLGETDEILKEIWSRIDEAKSPSSKVVE